jgi:hypothetical protein
MPQVNDYLFTMVRSVFLTKEKVAHTKVWGGIKPRIKRTGNFAQTDPKRDTQGDYEMMYEGPPITPIKLSEFVEILKKYQNTKSLSEKEKRELDIFTSLHTFGLQSNVVMKARPKPQSVPVNASGKIIMSNYDVEFKSWTTNVVDDYDWNVKLGFPIPNPDFNSKVSGSIAPTKETIVIYHENARRVENAGLAVPYKVISDPWTVTEKRVIDGDVIDLAGFKG